MAAELRWILLVFSALLLGGIVWWGARRSRQSAGNSELRGSAVAPHAPAPGPGPGPAYAAAAEDENEPILAERGDWGVPPFEPLNIRTADFEQVHVMDPPMSATSDPLDVAMLNPESDFRHEEPESAAESDLESEPELAPKLEPALQSEPEPAEGPASVPVQVSPAQETQRIVTIRVCAQGDSRWSGSDLIAALETQGLRFGRYKVFHRLHGDGRTLFCAASLVEPGAFDIEWMPETQFRGVTLFAVLPGPADAVQTVDALILTAEELAISLAGVVQDSKGTPLSPQRAEALREDVAHFQAMLARP